MSGALGHDLSTKRFWRHFTKDTLSGVGGLAVLIGLYDVIFPGVVARADRAAVFLVVGVSLLYGLWRAWPRPIEESYVTPNTVIRIVRGDLLAETCHLVVGTCDTFDTRVPDVIARSSVQGQFLETILNNDVDELDRQIDTALAGIASVGTVEKLGKRRRYPIGTVAVLRESRRKHFLLAYTVMEADNQAHGTADGVWRSLLNLWDVVRRESNGEPVAIPVIGGGQSRLSQILPAQDSIRFIAMSFILASRYEKVCGELRIVVTPQDYERLDRLEVQSFLSSLRAS